LHEQLAEHLRSS